MKYLLCGQPTFMWSMADILEWQRELLSLDQRDEGVIDALKEVRAVLAAKESQS